MTQPQLLPPGISKQQESKTEVSDDLSSPKVRHFTRFRENANKAGGLHVWVCINVLIEPHFYSSASIRAYIENNDPASRF